MRAWAVGCLVVVEGKPSLSIIDCCYYDRLRCLFVTIIYPISDLELVPGRYHFMRKERKRSPEKRSWNHLIRVVYMHRVCR